MYRDNYHELSYWKILCITYTLQIIDGLTPCEELSHLLYVWVNNASHASKHVAVMLAYFFMFGSSKP